MILPEVNNRKVDVRSLICHRDVELSLHCLESIEACSRDPVRIVLHDDGSLTEADHERIESVLKCPHIVNRPEADAVMAERLGRHPNAQAFRKRSVWGLKLLDIVLLEGGDCFYADGDIRFFRPFMGLFTGAAVRGRSVFLADTVWEAYSIRPWHLMDRRRLSVQSGINTGLTLIDGELYDLDFVDWFLSQPDWHCIPAWAEPTCWAALASRANGHVVAPTQIVNLYPKATITEDSFGGHFLSSYRGGWTGLLQSQIKRDAPPVSAEFVRTSRCSPARLLWNQLKRKTTNTLKAYMVGNGCAGAAAGSRVTSSLHTTDRCFQMEKSL